jgi:hypothetical protein
MLYLPIRRSWLFSPTARRVYLLCAVLALGLIATEIGVYLAMSAAGAGKFTPAAALFVRALLYPEIAGTALLWIAMWYFWFGFDSSHYLKKALWFVFLFFLAPFGTLIYYFVAYRRFVSAQALASIPCASA